MATVTADNQGLRLLARYAVLILVAIIFIFPLLFMVMSSLIETGPLRAQADAAICPLVAF